MRISDWSSDVCSSDLRAARYPGELLMEQLVEGGEYTIGVLDGRALASIHIVPAGEYYDYHANYVAEDTQYVCPGLDEAGEAEARDPAERTFPAPRLRGWARVEVMPRPHDPNRRPPTNT